jgi:uncharacterized protein
MAGRFLWLAAILLGWLALATPASAKPTFPELTGRVTDAATILPSPDRVRIAGKLEALEKQTGRQVVVVTLPSLQDHDIADYGYQLGRHWAIGRKGLNDGAILIVAPKERKVRIEVGYGLEGVLTDGMSSLIINDKIVPRFKQDDMTGGIEAGVDAIAEQLQLPPEEAQRLASEADAGKDDGGIGVLIFIAGIFLFIGFVIWLIARAASRSGRSYAGGGAPVTVWDTGNSSSSDWSSSSSSDSGSNFSGGGGDFGGGGASGDW